MKVAIRTDASAEIGSGHVMRCLCLAQALRARGAEVMFVSRALPPHLAQTLAAGDCKLSPLRLDSPAPSAAPQQAWPSAYQLEDARATAAALGSFGADWLIADHYGLDHSWESAMRRVVPRVFALDDLGRQHDCDLLLDQTFHPQPRTRYASRVPAGATLLLGPRYALLRPEFRQARAGAGVRQGPVRRILVFMGGMDAGNATGLALDAIALLPDAEFALDVVIGPMHPARAAIEQFCHDRPGATCHVQTPAMAALLATSDLAVGAGGGATWERCCLGVPALALPLADNQHALLAGAARVGLVYVPDGGVPTAATLAVHLRALIANGALRESISAAGLALVDGRGAERVAAAIAGSEIRVRPARAEDCEPVHRWRNAAAVRSVSRTNAPIEFAEHQRWFTQVLQSPDRPLLVGEDAQGPVGVVRFDIDDSEAEVSIYLAEPRLGQGLGPGLLAAAEQWLMQARPQVTTILAETMAGNVASQRLFEDGGYQLRSRRFMRRIKA
jgi:UDP-2,4-diacetamido-2,4,6-trideoxy-beta-L-altropyranose hydrolase